MKVVLCPPNGQDSTAPDSILEPPDQGADNYVMCNVIHFLLAFVPGVSEETFSVQSEAL